MTGRNIGPQESKRQDTVCRRDVNRKMWTDDRLAERPLDWCTGWQAEILVGRTAKGKIPTVCMRDLNRMMGADDRLKIARQTNRRMDRMTGKQASWQKDRHARRQGAFRYTWIVPRGRAWLGTNLAANITWSWNSKNKDLLFAGVPQEGGGRHQESWSRRTACGAQGILKVHYFFTFKQEASRSGPFYNQAKMVRKTLIPMCFVTFLWLVIFENDVNVASKSNKQKD